MKKFQLSSTFYYLPIIFLIVLSIIFPIKNYSTYVYWLKPLFWIIYSVICYFLLSNKKGRYKYKTGKVKTIIILTLFYLIIWFSLGLVFGFTTSSYAHSFLKILRNIWAFVLILIFREFVRMKLIENDRSTINIILVTVLFFLSEINISSIISNMETRELAFQYYSGILFPVLVKNVLLTYLCSVGGFKCSLSYVVLITLADILLPILPNLDWFFGALTSSVISAVIGVIVYQEHQKKVIREVSKKQKKNGLFTLIEMTLVVIFSLFVAGVFKYQPIAVLTYSMKPVFTRGDVVIIEKLNDKEKRDIKVNDVIQYKLNNYVVIHRVIKIEEDREGNILFTTKGDHNKSADDKKVKMGQVIGVAKVYIPKIGYPSVWLNEFLDEQKVVEVET